MPMSAGGFTAQMTNEKPLGKVISTYMTLLQALVRFCNHLQVLVRTGAHQWAHACIGSEPDVSLRA